MAAHVLVFPFPLQGHLNCMLHFTDLLLSSDHQLHVTFLHSHHNLRRLNACSSSPRLRFLSIPDGLPDDHPRSVRLIMELFDSVSTRGSVAYRALLSTLCTAGTDGFPPLSCVIADGLISFPIDIAEEFGVPALSFRTISACCFLAYFSIPNLLELGELPFPDGGDLDHPVRGVLGMESFLRRRDLPKFYRQAKSREDPTLQRLAAVTASSAKARALILNTAPSLEPSALAHISPQMRETFAIGPLHAMSPAVPASLWLEDRSCISWLNGQPDRSVVYVSLGSLTVMSHEQFTEFLTGLVNAGYRFLWVLRSDMVEERQNAVLQQAIEAAGSRAHMVESAPQRDVLRHRAVGCFLTHSGWNSTLEGIMEGVPMVCWPFMFDQQINSRFVAAVWKTGLDMKDSCDRAVVERMVREVMDSDEIRRSAQELAQQVRRDTSNGGSSAMELKRLIGFIKELSASGTTATVG